MATMMVFDTTIDRYIDYDHYSNTTILSPFNIKGRGWIKTKTRFFFSCRRKSSVDMMCTEVTMLPLSSRWIFKHIFNEVHDFMTFPITKDSYLHKWSNQVDLHMWLKYPTNWVYTFWLNYPTKWVYKFEEVLTWLNITIYIIGLNITFSS